MCKLSAVCNQQPKAVQTDILRCCGVDRMPFKRASLAHRTDGYGSSAPHLSSCSWELVQLSLLCRRAAGAQSSRCV